MKRDIPLELIALYDIYGELLSTRQQEFFEYYYHDDLSLAEIAENAGITRQGVLDNLKRAESRLRTLEQKLMIYSGKQALQNNLAKLTRTVSSIPSGQINPESQRKILDIIEEINK